MDAMQAMLPAKGRIECDLCFRNQPVVFNETRREEDGWRITANPLSWGNQHPEIILLGFSKGPKQIKDLLTTPHDEIAYKEHRTNVGKILAHIGLIGEGDNTYLKRQVDALIADQFGRFHTSSLIRCTVERYDEGSQRWLSTGGGMLDRFINTPFGKEVTSKCMARFLSNLPDTTKLVVLFGMGKKGNYTNTAYELIQRVRPGSWERLNDVAYTDQKVTFVHVEHFASQGKLIPSWIGTSGYENDERRFLGLQAREAVQRALSNSRCAAP